MGSNNVKITERDIIDKIVLTEKLDLIEFYGIKASDFKQCREHIDFIIDYNQKFGKVPDMSVMRTKFSDYFCNTVDATEEYLAYHFKESRFNNVLVNILQQAATMSDKDSFEASNFLQAKLQEIEQEGSSGVVAGYDIVARARDRFNKFKENQKQEVKSKKLSFGIAELDEAVMGIENDDYITILARPNVGKSQIAQYIGVNIWESGKKVLYYSGEMDIDSMGYRFDTWCKNFSNRALRTGNVDRLGGNHTQYTYEEYIFELEEKSGFIVVTPQDFGGNRPTVKDIEKMIKLHKPDIVILDQISLMKDFRGAKQIREQYVNISTDVLTYVNSKKIPFIVVAQANRAADAKNKGKEDDEVDAPELHEIMESDKIGQDSKKVISLAFKDNILYLVVKKARNGGKDTVVKMHWNIDRGILKPLLEGKNETALREEFGV